MFNVHTQVGPNPAEFLADPLSPISRCERRNLLLTSVLGILLAQAGLLPTQISTLGIVLSIPDQRTILIVNALIIFYFIVAFGIFGISDLMIWRMKYQKYLEDVEQYMSDWTAENQHVYDNSSLPKISWLYRGAKLLAFFRVNLFEYALPLAVGLYADVVLLIAVMAQ